MEIKIKPVESSMIRGIGYHPESETLRVQFTKGAEWDYSPISADSYRALLNAKSIGSFFHKKIRSAVAVEARKVR